MSDRPVPSGDPDWQAKRVYEWERRHIERFVGDVIMSRDGCENLIRKASAYLQMRAPKVVYLKLDGPTCWAFPDRHEIHIEAWGRSHVTLLHELAHLDTWGTVLRGEAPHGPTFVGCAMTLYARFLRVPIPHLTSTARIYGIEFTPPMGPALALPPD